ncbi:hypothetical protein PIB30_081151 [Stylosanthes scabra]|uniref:Uncharacterized protein n=1 Tax=Stylosanthes scabra TaxID=79078 RepID=A0ABU6WPX4_9FABA|nr:hypothetical protein [Stylosanthes scabra]
MVEQNPEEGKKSGKLRRTIRETDMDLYGYKKVGVVFPSVAFIFGERKDPHEVLYKRGSRQMDREDFGTLLPRNEPSNYVMEQIAFKAAWTHSQLQETTYWSLPVYFSDCVLGVDVTIEDLFSMFKAEWLPRPVGLRYIYVQMKEFLYPSKEAHLYLMATALDHILRVGFHGIDVLGQKRPLHKWDPDFVLGVPNMGNP